MKTLICTTPGNLEYKTGEKLVLQKGQAIIKVKRIGIADLKVNSMVIDYQVLTSQ